VRWLVVSLALHAVVLWLVVGSDARGEPRAAVTWSPPVLPSASRPDVAEPMVVEMLGGGGGTNNEAASATTTRAAHVGARRARSADAWSSVSIKTEAHGDSGGTGAGTGGGTGSGTGSGIGFGSGGGIEVTRDVPAPPPPPKVSKARPAKLIWPNRDLDVEDESYLFVAKVTVDADGSVVGARMLTSRPGSRADHAANAIWTFRYAPALDDDGRPIRSTFEQPFQVR
jgi:hypothetical protein